jgi:hypothetical protein
MWYARFQKEEKNMHAIGKSFPARKLLSCSADFVFKAFKFNIVAALAKT